ncbi:MAG: galactokinase [Desulfobacterales bacterium]
MTSRRHRDPEERPVDWAGTLEREPVVFSAPCRVDMGGTLDIRSLFVPLAPFRPCTVNLALELRTTVRLEPHVRGRLRVSSRGFPGLDAPRERMPFRHPLGLFFAAAAMFGADGVHIRIDSASPPRSGLGGSSVAAVALVRALFEARRRAVGEGASPPDPARVARIAQAIEEAVAGVPCGLQDQLAAACGGVNAWEWRAADPAAPYRRRRLLAGAGAKRLEKSLLLAYLGVPHDSADVNGRWIRDFLAGRRRAAWQEIAALSRDFAAALSRGDLPRAAEAMARETAIRRRMTPEVVDGLGARLLDAAGRRACGARFTGAGAGGCLWALGPPEAIAGLAGEWAELLSRRPGAGLLPTRIARRGLLAERP